jgi:hypothetical protein
VLAGPRSCCSAFRRWRHRSAPARHATVRPTSGTC